MTLDIIFACLLTGFIYSITPGPVFLYTFGVVAHRGLVEGFKVVGGSFAGDVFWVSAALFSLVFSYAFDGRVFLALGIICGSYLVYLGGKALFLTSRAALEATSPTARSFRRGLVLGALNPKSYPVMLATLTALIGEKLHAFDNTAVMETLLIVLIGVLTAYAVIVFACAHRRVKELFPHNSFLITRAIGALFIFFGGKIAIASLIGFAQFGEM
jgi:threonine/homoserine/homoserine lactone efflux protein